MAITTLNQELWSNLLLEGTQKSLVFQDCARHIGTVHADEVHFSNIGSVTVGAYTKNTDISNQTLTDSGIDLDLNQQQYFSVNVDDIDNAQTDVNVLSEVIRKGTHGLKNEIDEYVAGLHASAGIVADLGTDEAAIDINSSSVLTYFRLISQKLDEANADISSRWIVIPPWMKNKLSTALPSLDTNNSEMLRSGFIGMFSGLKVYVSNNIKNTAGALYKVMAGDGDAFRMGLNVLKIESLRNNAQFGDIVRGLVCFGAVATSTATLACLTADPAADA